VIGRAGLAFRYVSLALIAGIALNTTHPPLDDARVRRAIAASIDRQAISDKITFKRYPVVDTAQPLGSWARDPGVHLPAYDPAAADKLLDAAGWSGRGTDGIRMKGGKRLALTYVQFREPDRRARRGVHRARAARARHRPRIEVGDQREAVLAEVRGRRARVGRLRSRLRAVADGRRSGRQLSLDVRRSGNVMRWCDPEVDALERPRARRTDPSRADGAL